MDSNEFFQVRHSLGKTQDQLSQLLCVSPKAIQSYEQGWRRIPANIERQLLFLLSLRRSLDEKAIPCWEKCQCNDSWKQKCSAWEFKAGYLCWFINGTFCHGEAQEDWDKKLEICRQCEVLKEMIPSL